VFRLSVETGQSIALDQAGVQTPPQPQDASSTPITDGMQFQQFGKSGPVGTSQLVRRTYLADGPVTDSGCVRNVNP